MDGILGFIAQAVTVAVCIAAVVMILTVFFNWQTKHSSRQPGVDVAKVEDIFDPAKFYDIMLNSGQMLQGLQFDGMVRLTGDNDLASPLRGMAVLRYDDGRKVILRMDTVRVFEEARARPDINETGQ